MSDILSLDLSQIQKLQAAISYNFKDISLLEEALSHPSLKQLGRKVHYKNYERLEILGDSILGFLITEILFHKYTEYDEGNLAKIKAHLICKDTLSNIAEKLHIDHYIIMTKGEELSGGRDNPSNLENTMEALIAAIYLDSNINETRRVVCRLWLSYIDNINLEAIDPKTHLQEWSQSKLYGIPNYQVTERSGPVHAPIFQVTVIVGKKFQASGRGKSIKLAEKNAAEALLKQIN